MLPPDDEVDRTSPVPLHNQLYHLIKQEFTTQFQPGEMLPPEMDLADRFQVGRGTIRNALKALTSEGLIERIAGRGSFLREDALVRLRHYRVAVVLGRDEAWGPHLEVLNGVLGAQAGANLSLELVDRETFDGTDAGFDGFLHFGPVPAPRGRTPAKPTVAVRYEVDLAQGFALVVDDLVGRGYLRPAFVGEPGQGRLAAVSAALAAHGLAPLDPAVQPPADCFVCSSDSVAVGMVATLKDRGLEVGETGVYGFGGSQPRSPSAPEVTTCAFDWAASGAFAVRELRSLLDGGPPVSFQPLQGRLVWGRSTRKIHGTP